MAQLIRARRNAPFLFFLFLIAIVIWWLSSLTPLLMDDYDYSFSWATGQRLSGISDVLASQAAHWHLWGGRSIAHFFAQLFLYLGKPVFNVLNPVIYLILLLSILRLGRCQFHWLYLVAVHLTLFLLLPGFGTVFLWLDGSCNYLWCTVLALFPLIVTSFLDDGFEVRSSLCWAFIIPLCFLSGWTNENTACGVLAGRLLWLYFRRKRGERILIFEIGSLAAEVAGILLLLLAPGNLNRAAIVSVSLLIRFRSAVVTILYVAAYAAPLILVTLIGLPAESKTRDRFFVLTASGVLSGLAMIASPEFSPRTLTGMAVLLLSALFSVLPENRSSFLNRRVEVIAFVLTAAIVVVSGIDASREIGEHANAWQKETRKIEEATANGQEAVEIREVPARGRFTTSILLSEDPDAWPNHTLGKYYGIQILKE